MAVEVHETIEALMYEHRVAWAAAVLGEDAVDLAAADDPSAALAGATAARWLDGYVPAAREALVEAAARGVRLVVAVAADTADGDDLVRALPGATVVAQVPAGGSLIGAGGSAQVQVEDAPSPDRAAWLLVCANADADAAGAQASIGVMAGVQLANYVARLEDALEALRDANVRLAREQLGRHDAAAGTIIGRADQRVQAAEREAADWKGRFEFEQQLAMKHHEWFVAARDKLEQPHHRAAERAAKVPGVRPLLRRLIKG